MGLDKNGRDATEQKQDKNQGNRIRIYQFFEGECEFHDVFSFWLEIFVWGYYYLINQIFNK